MRIHHLNCGSHCPLGGWLFDGRSRGLFADLCTHCLLIETEQGLVLVDTGYGLRDVLHSRPRRLPYLWTAILNVDYRREDTAVCQVEALGFSLRDVRHIVLTHLDFDHSGGIADFPMARVHVMAEELHRASGRLRGLVARQRYRPANWKGVGDWRTYVADHGEPWFGFEAVRDLDGLPPEILMIPLSGHTHGHAGVAVNTGNGWLLHAGDAYLNAGQLDHPPRMPFGLAVYERIMAADTRAARRNLSRLRELAANRRDVQIICSHDTETLKRLRSR